MTSVFSFHAQVAAETIEKVGRLFNASLDDILNELLQNARRAGATKILIDQVNDSHFRPAIRIADNGAGLADPRALFSLGRSEWSQSLVRSEGAAGMGFFSLANRGAVISSRHKDEPTSWSITATPDAFHGRCPIEVAPADRGHPSMTVVFPEAKSDNLVAAVRQAVRYFPVPVKLNGEDMESSDFLERAGYVEEWMGIRIGIFASDFSYDEPNNANFHGMTLRMPLPILQQSWHRSYHARIDVIDCACLKLVLPARKEVVQDEMFGALIEEINRIFFRLVAENGPHSLSFDDHRRAKLLGVDLPEAASLLMHFVPSFADSHRSLGRSPMAVPSDALLFSGSGPLEEQNVARALARLPESPPLFEPNHPFAGYSWYDRLATMTVKTFGMAFGDEVEDVEPPDMFARAGRPDRLEIKLEIGSGEIARPWTLDTDLIVTGVEYEPLDEMDIRVIHQSKITPQELKSFLTDALFCPSDDAEAGSYEQQERWFADEAEDLSITLLRSAEASDLNAIKRAVVHEIAWRLPKDKNFVIRIDGGKVTVKGLPVASPDEPAPPIQPADAAR